MASIIEKTDLLGMFLENPTEKSFEVPFKNCKDYCSDFDSVDDNIKETLQDVYRDFLNYVKNIEIDQAMVKKYTKLIFSKVESLLSIDENDSLGKTALKLLISIIKGAI